MVHNQRLGSLATTDANETTGDLREVLYHLINEALTVCKTLDSEDQPLHVTISNSEALDANGTE
ncbi:MAG: hypothetical protein ACJAVI_003706 [Candidatus Azotimanducaceae bacterium]|jgi:hypothetical protein